MRKRTLIVAFIFISVAVFCHYFSFWLWAHPLDEETYVLDDGTEITLEVHTDKQLVLSDVLFNFGVLPLFVGLIMIGYGIFIKEKSKEVPKKRKRPIGIFRIEDVLREKNEGMVKCRQCWGTGECNVCRGKGIMITGISKKNQCTNCKGSGLCPECKGYGYEDLPDEASKGTNIL